MKVERGGKRGEVWGQNINNKNIKLQEKNQKMSEKKKEKKVTYSSPDTYFRL